ncbi:hypothetical protein [Methanosarcina sp.]|uniref:hypothetical protein n=1 Tax=Methanosarcina sp. TaxID=2213 RepID=UPI002ABD0E23|nr:hypothetical protein [Methanosarcina sp.]MDY9924965.1 hypothetical protein [Methanosarcina sp.]
MEIELETELETELEIELKITSWLIEGIFAKHRFDKENVLKLFFINAAVKQTKIFILSDIF